MLFPVYVPRKVPQRGGWEVVEGSWPTEGRQSSRCLKPVAIALTAKNNPRRNIFEPVLNLSNIFLTFRAKQSKAKQRPKQAIKAKAPFPSLWAPEFPPMAPPFYMSLAEKGFVNRPTFPPSFRVGRAPSSQSSVFGIPAPPGDFAPPDRFHSCRYHHTTYYSLFIFPQFFFRVGVSPFFLDPPRFPPVLWSLCFF